MRLAWLALLFFSISLPLAFMGYQSPAMQLFAQQGNSNIDATYFLLNVVGPKLLNLGFVSLILGLAAALVVISGFSAVYLIPAVIFEIVINFVLIPSSSLFSTVCSPNNAVCVPPLIGAIITIFLNLLVILAMAEYIRGGG